MIEYLILGLMQGITEWLPISSQGQTVLLSQFLGMPAETALDLAIWLHLGTLFAALIYFRSDISRIFNEEKRYLLRFLVISTIATGIIGAPLYIFVEDFFAGNAGSAILALVGLMLIVSGMMQKRAKEGLKKEVDIGDSDSIVTGIAQGLSVLPGISRSGMTSSILLLRGYDSESALRLSFMMSIFAVAMGQIGLQLKGGFVVSPEATLAMVASFATGLLSIDLLLKLAHRIKFWKFLFVMGALTILFAASTLLIS